MSLAVGQTTSLFITYRKAELEFRLLQINDDLQRLSTYSVEASNQMMAAYRGQVNVNGIDIGSNSDDAAELIDIVNNSDFTAAYEAMLYQYTQKEKVLTNQKQQIETEEKALNTQEEGVQKMIDKDIQGAFKYAQ